MSIITFDTHGFIKELISELIRWIVSVGLLQAVFITALLIKLSAVV